MFLEVMLARVLTTLNIILDKVSENAPPMSKRCEAYVKIYNLKFVQAVQDNAKAKSSRMRSICQVNAKLMSTRIWEFCRVKVGWAPNGHSDGRLADDGTRI